LQTKRQIQQLLASAGITANKRLGQHFLIDLNLMRLLVDSANISSSDIVLEVGCGTGSLTEAIASLAGKIIAVEIDSNLAKIAKKRLAGTDTCGVVSARLGPDVVSDTCGVVSACLGPDVVSENVIILNTDILENKNTISQTVIKSLREAHKKQSGRLLLVANLPYNVASAVMINLVTGSITAPHQLNRQPRLEPKTRPVPLSLDNWCGAMYVTVQKEVADRMTAAPGSRDYGTLSILLNAIGDIKTIRTLKPTVFWPQPQVDSAMVSFIRKEEKAGRIRNIEIFSKTVRLFMQHRRKMLKACVKFAAGPLGKIRDWSQIFEQCSIDPRQRGEQLSPENYIALANLLALSLSKGAAGI
jgi:16S rRNA (adenine1518-N6/adenine1519-N6)-dimethyltransferase